MADDPLAYFLTIHTYGSWRHSHESGSLDWGHNLYGESLARPNPQREAAMRRRMRNEPVTLNTAQRVCVHDSCRETYRHRHWPLHALHVCTTHLHLVLSALVDPEQVVDNLKIYGTRRLRQNCRGGTPNQRDGRGGCRSDFTHDIGVTHSARSGPLCGPGSCIDGSV